MEAPISKVLQIPGGIAQKVLLRILVGSGIERNRLDESNVREVESVADTSGRSHREHGRRPLSQHGTTFAVKVERTSLGKKR